MDRLQVIDNVLGMAGTLAFFYMIFGSSQEVKKWIAIMSGLIILALIFFL